MESKKDIQHVYLVGAKSLGAYGGYVGFNKEVAENCALYWSRKPGSLARLIDRTDKMSDEEIAEMGQKAKKRVAEEYTWDKICGQYEGVFVGK